MRSAWLKVALLGCCLLGFGGCGGSSPRPMIVTGVVYYAGPVAPASSSSSATTEVIGKPIAGAKVTFHDQAMPVGYGITDSLGRFRIRTYPATAEPIDGLPLGLYAVTITKLSLVEKALPASGTGSAAAANDQTLPARYARPETTEWQAVEVRLESSANHFRLAVSE